MEAFFAEHRTIIIFLHVISGVVWVGGMIAMRYAAHHSFLKIQTPKDRLSHIAYALKRLFTIVFPFVLVLLVTAIFMIKGYSLRSSEYSIYAHLKEAIWTIMFLNLLYMIYRRNKASKFLDENNVALAKAQLEPIAKFMVPLNIVLGIIAILLGTTLSTSL